MQYRCRATSLGDPGRTRFSGASCNVLKGELSTRPRRQDTAGPSGTVQRWLHALDPDDVVKFNSLDPDGFDRIDLPGGTFRIPKGPDRLQAALMEAFPADCAANGALRDPPANRGGAGRVRDRPKETRASSVREALRGRRDLQYRPCPNVRDDRRRADAALRAILVLLHDLWLFRLSGGSGQTTTGPARRDCDAPDAVGARRTTRVTRPARSS